MSIDLGVAPGAILVVDDDEDHLALLAQQLRRSGPPHPDAQRSLQGARRPRAFCGRTWCLLDQRMPGLSGLDICRRIRALPDHEFLPVILLTNDASLEVSAAAVAAGVNDFLDKSAPSEILRLRITAALRAKRLADLAARRFEEQAYLARVAEDLANSLAEDALLATAARALGRFEVSALYVVVLSEQDRPQLLSFGVDPVEIDRERLDTLLHLAQSALRTNLHAEEVSLQHLPVDWPPSVGRPLIHRVLRANPRPRVWLAIEPTHPLDDDELRLFDAVTDRLAAPLENARLYARVSAAHEEIAATLEKLRQAQASLVHTEKMASIGQLAAGGRARDQQPARVRDQQPQRAARVRPRSGTDRAFLPPGGPLRRHAPLDARSGVPDFGPREPDLRVPRGEQPGPRHRQEPQEFRPQRHRHLRGGRGPVGGREHAEPARRRAETALRGLPGHPAGLQRARRPRQAQPGLPQPDRQRQRGHPHRARGPPLGAPLHGEQRGRLPGGGQRHGHPPRRPGQDLRALFHDETGRPRYRPRPGHHRRDHPPARGTHHGGHRGGAGHDVHGAPARPRHPADAVHRTSPAAGRSDRGGPLHR
jgi:CheY-like chemotaxis protein